MLTLPIKKKWFDMICSGEKQLYNKLGYCSKFEDRNKDKEE